ncbi:hypothetical protein [Micromonospora sp. NPDC085948]|uniref:hypothetical protein n=1 Tax=Micromonospora sp. NPDC085948 TaxID=3155293 RepID=UPI003415F4A6
MTRHDAIIDGHQGGRHQPPHVGQASAKPPVEQDGHWKEVRDMAKNTGRGHRVGAVKKRSEFKVGTTWFKHDTTTGRILNGSAKQHKGVCNEK